VTARRAALVLAAAAALAAGCARKLPPSGGPPDIQPPSLVLVAPDSGAVGVPLDATVRLRFSESVDRASVAQSVLFGPGVRDPELRWEDGRTVVLRPRTALVAGRTYVVYVGVGVRDVRGNPIDHPGTIHFTTADSFPPGAIEGAVEGRGVSPAGVYIWGYREDLGHAPDSTAYDMDALGRSGPGGGFRLPGLPVPGSWRLYSFVDRNRNGSFEPGPDLLTRSDSLIELSAAAPRAVGVRLVAVDPEALAQAEGAVIDSLAPGAEPLRVEARAVPVDSAVAADRVPVLNVDVLNGHFAFNLRAGRWRLTAYRDLDGDRVLAPNEPRSPAVEINVLPGGVVRGLELTLAPAAGSSP
jgi:hypothetical protein